MERQRQELGLGDTNGRLALYLIKRYVTIGQSLIHKTENLLDIIYDNFVHFLHREDSENFFRKESQFLLHNHI